jgi:hypothetical protein
MPTVSASVQRRVVRNMVKEALLSELSGKRHARHSYS